MKLFAAVTFTLSCFSSAVANPGAVVASADPAFSALEAKFEAKLNALTNQVNALSTELASYKKVKATEDAILSKTHLRRRLNGDAEEAPVPEATEGVENVQAQSYLALLAKIGYIADKVESIDNCVHYVEGPNEEGSSDDMDGTRCYIGSFQEHQISRVIIDGFDSVSIDASDFSADILGQMDLSGDEVDIDARGDSFSISAGSSSIDIAAADSMSISASSMDLSVDHEYSVDVGDMSVSASQDFELSVSDSISISASESIDIDGDESVDINDVMRVAPTSQDDVGDIVGADEDEVSTPSSEDAIDEGPEEVSSSNDELDGEDSGDSDEKE